MAGWQSVVVFVVLTVVAREALAHPRALEDDSAPTLLKINDDVDQKQRSSSMWMPVERRKLDLEDEPKKPRSASHEHEDSKKMDIQTDDTLGVPREFLMKEQNKEQKKIETTALAKVESGIPEVNEEQKEDDPTRSKKSPDMRELSFHQSPTTTVCIQVRSDHRPSSVVCGPQVGDDKTASSPRNAYAPPPSQAQGLYDPQYMQGERVPPQKFYIRAKPEDIEPPRSFASPGKQQIVRPQPMPIQPAQGPPMSPKAAKGPNVFRRTQPDDDNTLKQPEGAQPATSIQPFRIIPQGPPASVVVHKQYYQAPLSPIASNFIAPAQVPLRLNCALQPEGGQFLQTYGTPMLRSASSGILPGYEVIIPDGPPTRNTQGLTDYQYYYDPQGRAAEEIESAYENAEPWVGTTFVGEDGQLYKIDDSQGRSALEDQWDQPIQRASSNSMTLEELTAKFNDQRKELSKASEELKGLQATMKEMKQRAMGDDDDVQAKKKHPQSTDNAKESSPPRDPPSEETKKPVQSKNKRQSYHHMSRK